MNHMSNGSIKHIKSFFYSSCCLQCIDVIGLNKYNGCECIPCRAAPDPGGLLPHSAQLHPVLRVQQAGLVRATDHQVLALHTNICQSHYFCVEGSGFHTSKNKEHCS